MVQGLYGCSIKTCFLLASNPNAAPLDDIQGEGRVVVPVKHAELTSRNSHDHVALLPTSLSPKPKQPKHPHCLWVDKGTPVL